MSKPTQPLPASLLAMLVRNIMLARSILETEPPEINDPLRQFRKDADSKNGCDCPTCNLRRSFAELLNEAARIQFKLVLEGSVSMEIADMVGGIKADSEADDSKDRANRVMAALLIATAKESNADTEDKKILKANALENFTKGINALNALRASATPVTA